MMQIFAVQNTVARENAMVNRQIISIIELKGVGIRKDTQKTLLENRRELQKRLPLKAKRSATVIALSKRVADDLDVL